MQTEEKTSQYDLFNEEPVIRTYTGKYINPVAPLMQDICIEDIAHALSQMPRFGGHTDEFYSVAEHSINCMQLFCEGRGWTSMHKEEVAIALQVLMHDATEAYLLDLPAPIKRLLPFYRDIEKSLHLTISLTLGIPTKYNDEVKSVDTALLKREWDFFMVKTTGFEFKRYNINQAEATFLALFKECKSVLNQQ